MLGNLFWGYHAKNHHGNKPTEARETSGVIAFDAGTRERPPLLQHQPIPSSLDGQYIGGDPSPAINKLLETEGDAHTVPLRGALSHNLNSHLKSLRNEGKKDRRSKKKRARRKDRSSEKDDYLALEYSALD